MDKRVIFSVAGSGKTSYILDQLSLDKSSLIITYTNNNYKNIRQRILSKWGYIPDNIKVMTYFAFVYSFCFKPLLGHQHKAKGIIFEPNGDMFANGDARYFSSGGRLYSNRIAKLFEIKSILAEINERIAKYYESVYIDEVQDLGGHDFNFLKSISRAPVNVLMVGDFYQHTFDTSRDGRVNSTLHDSLKKYQAEFAKMGVIVDESTLSKSYRCSQDVCDFIKENLGIMIDSHREDKTDIHLIESEKDAKQIIENQTIVKLFYQQHYAYNCYSRNWGDCKGEDIYKDVCVVLSKKGYQDLKKKKLKSAAARTLNKLYVACSRSKGNLIILSEGLFLSGHKLKE